MSLGNACCLDFFQAIIHLQNENFTVSNKEVTKAIELTPFSSVLASKKKFFIQTHLNVWITSLTAFVSIQIILANEWTAEHKVFFIQ